MVLSPWIVLLATLAYGLLHSLLASLQMKALARRWSSTEHWYRLVYNAIAVISLLPVLALVGLLPDQQLYRIPYPWVVVTTAVLLLALAGLAIGLLQTGVWSFLGLSQIVKPESYIVMLKKNWRIGAITHSLFNLWGVFTLASLIT